MVCACNLSIHKASKGRSEIQGNLWIHKKFETRLGYMKHWFKKAKKKRKKYFKSVILASYKAFLEFSMKQKVV